MQLAKILLGLSILITLLVLILSVMNWQSQEINLFGTMQHLPLGMMILIACVSGALVPLSLLLVGVGRRQGQTKQLQEWQKQDAKLLNQIASDREKQLEAKIVTLEAALKVALKKK
jgi:uncharacterized integral membrane protein